MKSYNRLSILDGIRYFLLSIIALTILYPMAWMVATSFKTQRDLFRTITSLIPPQINLGNYEEVIVRTDFFRYYLNSTVVALAAVFGLLLITSLAAFSFARLKWRGQEATFIFVMLGQLVSPAAILIPVFIIADRLRFTDSHVGLVALYLSRVSFGVLILRTFFESIPREIEEAAYIDGCSRLGLYWRIMMPLARPALAAIGIFYFFFVWNDFIYPFLILQDQELITLPVAIFNLKGRYNVAWGNQTAALTMAIVPAIIATIIFQKQIVRGLTAGAVK